jgi:hypothetical protein
VKTHVTYSEFHENTPPWRTQVVVTRGQAEVIRLAVHMISDELTADAQHRFDHIMWPDNGVQLHAALTSFLLRWLPVASSEAPQ